MEKKASSIVTQDGTPVVKGLRVVFRGPDNGFGIGRGRRGEVLYIYESHGVATVRWNDSSNHRCYAKHSNARFEDLEKETT